MGAIRKFSDLEAWKEAHALTVRVYQITKQFPPDEVFGLTSQLRRAASSIGANIAEGFGRFHYNDKIRFYLHSRGSVSELENHVLLSCSLKYINEETQNEIVEKCGVVGRLTNGLINAIRQ